MLKINGGLLWVQQPLIPQIQQPLPLPNVPNSPGPTHLPNQLVSNKLGQPGYNTRAQNLPTYVITTIPIQQVQLRSGKVFPQKPLIVIEEENEEGIDQAQSQENPQ